MKKQLVVLAALLASACADQGTTLLAPVARSNSMAPNIVTYPNTQKYQDNGKKAAHGRAGSAGMSVLALLGSDGVTDVSVTADAPGVLKKAQFKAFNANGELAYAFNKNDLGSAQTALQLGDRARGTTIQVQGNVTGSDPRRTDVVTVTETVKLRPDLWVSEVDAPQHALTDAPISVSAVVREVNGDVGARGDCVLYADGARVAQALGIWVDAAGTVSCAFQTSFHTTGQKELRVAVENVDPADYSNSNNANTATIQIDDPRPVSDFSYEATARSAQVGWGYAYATYIDNLYTRLSTSTGARDSHYDNIQEGHLSAYRTDLVQFPVDINASQSSGGNVLHSLKQTGVMPNWEDATPYYTEQCVLMDDPQTFTADDGVTQLTYEAWYFSLCSIHSPGSYDKTTIHYDTYIGDVTYWAYQFDASAPLYKSYNYNFSYNRRINGHTGDRVAVGPTFDFNVQLTYADGARHGVFAPVDLLPATYDHSTPTNSICVTSNFDNRPTTPDYGTRRVCYQAFDSQTGVAGSKSQSF